MTEEMITSRKSKLFWNFYRRTNASWLETWLSEILCPIFTRYWQSAQHNRKICIPLELFKKKLFDTVYYLRFLSSLWPDIKIGYPGRKTFFITLNSFTGHVPWDSISSYLVWQNQFNLLQIWVTWEPTVSPTSCFVIYCELNFIHRNRFYILFKTFNYKNV